MQESKKKTQDLSRPRSRNGTLPSFHSSLAKTTPMVKLQVKSMSNMLHPQLGHGNGMNTGRGQGRTEPVFQSGLETEAKRSFDLAKVIELAGPGAKV